MADSRHIARILGPTLLVLSLSEIVNPHIWAGVPVTQVYLAGSLWFVGGLAIISTHNRWSVGWPLLITIMGWFAMFGGLFRMFAPQLALDSTPRPIILLLLQIIMLVVGVILVFQGYRQSSK